MGLLVGLMLGIFLSLVGLVGFVWFLLRRADKEVFGRFLQAVAALLTKPDVENETPVEDGS
jgi:hypothetical protein